MSQRLGALQSGEWGKPKAAAALDAEWNRLREMPWPDAKGKGTWDETGGQMRGIKGEFNTLN